MVTHEKLFSDAGHFVGYAIYVNGVFVETCDYSDLHQTIAQVEANLNLMQ